MSDSPRRQSIRVDGSGSDERPPHYKRPGYYSQYTVSGRTSPYVSITIPEASFDISGGDDLPVVLAATRAVVVYPPTALDDHPRLAERRTINKHSEGAVDVTCGVAETDHLGVGVGDRVVVYQAPGRLVVVPWEDADDTPADPTSVNPASVVSLSDLDIDRQLRSEEIKDALIGAEFVRDVAYDLSVAPTTAQDLLESLGLADAIGPGRPLSEAQVATVCDDLVLYRPVRDASGR